MRMFRRSAGVRSCLVAACLFSTGLANVAFGEPLTGDMDQNETAVLEELNLARTRPSEFANYVEEHKRNFKGYFFVVLDSCRHSRAVPAL